MMRALGVLLAMSLLALPGVAQAQSGEVRAEAEQLFRAGEQAFNAGRYLAAARAFEQSYALLPLPAIGFSTAQAYRLQFFIDKEPAHLLQAIALYRRYLEEVSGGGRRDDAAAGLAELELLRASLERTGRLNTTVAPISAKTQLMITTQVSDAVVRVGAQEGTTPLIVEVEPGRHEVEVSAEGYFAVKQTAIAVESRLIVVELELEAQPAEVSVNADSGAAIAVDGRPAGVAPLARPLSLAAGTHFVAVTRRGHHAWAREIEIERGGELTLEPTLEVTGQRRASYWVLGAAGVAFGAAGGLGVAAWLTDRDLAELEDKRQRESLTAGEYAEYQRQQSRRNDRLRATYIALGVGAVAVAAGGLLYWFDNPRVAAGAPAGEPAPAEAASAPARSQRRVWFAPTLGPAQAGLGVAGRF